MEKVHRGARFCSDNLCEASVFYCVYAVKRVFFVTVYDFC